VRLEQIGGRKSAHSPSLVYHRPYVLEILYADLPDEQGRDMHMLQTSKVFEKVNL
jgi:hypothetical protein